MFNVKPHVPYAQLDARHKALRNAGDITQNVARTVQNSVLVPYNLVRKCLGRDATWIPSNHAQRVDLRRQARLQATESLRLGAVVRAAKLKEAEANLSRNPPDSERAAYEALRMLDGTRASTPGGYARIDAAQVRTVLDRMGLRGTVDPRFADIAIGEPALFEHRDAVYRNVYSQDKRFSSGVKLKAEGRVLLAAHYARKYGAAIEFNDIAYHPDQIRDGLPGLIAADRKRRGDANGDANGDLRVAHFFGREVHGLAAIYIRESGKEAVLLFDSSGREKVKVAEMLAEGQALAGGRPITIYEHSMPTQADAISCFAQTMKVCVETTRRIPGPDGNFGDYGCGRLLEKLDERVVAPSPAEAPLGKWIRPVRALPQVAKLSQSRAWLAEHAGGELDQPLHGTKRPHETLRQFTERFTYDSHTEFYSPDSPFERPMQVLDYTRQKGERYAELIQIEAWSRQIGDQLAPEEWTDQRKAEFMQEMKRLVRSPAQESPPVQLTDHGRLDD